MRVIHLVGLTSCLSTMLLLGWLETLHAGQWRERALEVELVDKRHGTVGVEVQGFKCMGTGG